MICNSLYLQIKMNHFQAHNFSRPDTYCTVLYSKSRSVGYILYNFRIFKLIYIIIYTLRYCTLLFTVCTLYSIKKCRFGLMCYWNGLGLHAVLSVFVQPDTMCVFQQLANKCNEYNSSLAYECDPFKNCLLNEID